MFPAIAVTCAIAAALAFAAAAVLEQCSAMQVPQREPLSPRLLLDLARRPLWLAAIGATIVGSALQITALHFGPLALVQPTLVCDLIFAVLIAAVAIRHHPPDKIMMLGTVCCAAGVAGFLAVARPGDGRESVSLPAVLPLAAALASVLAACLLAARRSRPAIRPLLLALACGIAYGATAFLLKLVTHSVSHGFSEPLRQWPLYAVVIVGPVGFLLNQNAFQAGILIAPVLAVITTVDPLVSIGIGHLWLGEAIASTPLDLAGEAAGLAVMTAGIVALAHRAPQAARSQAQAVRPASRPRLTDGESEPQAIASEHGAEP